MKRRILGKSGLDISEIGLGCWQFGGDFGPIEDERALATLASAREAGVNFFDTADVYGAGRSERLVGRSNAGLPDVVIATKVGRTPDLYPSAYGHDGVRAHLLASIERLGVQTLDLVQLHCVPRDVLEDGEIFETMNRLQAEGLCRAWGASVETIDEARLCLGEPGLASLQIIFNIFRQDAAWSLFEDAKAADVGIIVRLPLASGLLSGRYKGDERFAETDHRQYNRKGEAFSVGETFSGIPFEIGAQLARELSEHLPEGWNHADLALRWILDHDAVTTVIPGASRPEQARANARASTLPSLSDETHEALKTFYLSRVRDHIACPI